MIDFKYSNDENTNLLKILEHVRYSRILWSEYDEIAVWLRLNRREVV